MVLQAYSVAEKNPISFILNLNLSPSNFLCSLLLWHWKTQWMDGRQQDRVPLIILDLSYPFQVLSFSRLKCPMLLKFLCIEDSAYLWSSPRALSVSHIQIMKWILLQLVRDISISNLTLLGFSQMSWILWNSSNLPLQVYSKDSVSSIECICQLTDGEDSLSLTQNNEKLDVSLNIWTQTWIWMPWLQQMIVWLHHIPLA